MADRKTNKWLFLLPLAMFGFGYLMVPLYNVFCDVTSLNGKTGGKVDGVQVSAVRIDRKRVVRMEFVSSLNMNTPLTFRPDRSSIKVHPGQKYKVAYTAHNRKTRAMVGQAIPSVAPSEAAKYLKKIECFCFSRQAFKAGETREMPVVFFIDPDLPDYINTLTLSYTFFDVTDKVAKLKNP